MTSKEALERLKFIADKELNIGSKSYNDLQEFWNYKEPLKVIEKLVERDTPKKVITLHSGYIGNELLEPPIVGCPVCKEEVHISFILCLYCGQRLDWSERK